MPQMIGHGRGGVRIIDVLTHRTGLEPVYSTPYPPQTWDECRQVVSDSRMGERSMPGRDAFYQEVLYWYILGEFIRNVDGRSIPQYSREVLLKDSWLSGSIIFGRDILIDGRFEHVVPIRFGSADGVGAMDYVPIGPRHDAQEGWRSGMTTFGSARSAALFLTAGSHLHLPPGTLAMPYRIGQMDGYFRSIRDWGLGVMIESKRWGPASVVFSRRASHHTFGHVAGIPPVAVLTDPDIGLVVGLTGSGDFNAMANKHFLRHLINGVYEDLTAEGL